LAPKKLTMNTTLLKPFATLLLFTALITPACMTDENTTTDDDATTDVVEEVEETETPETTETVEEVEEVELSEESEEEEEVTELIIEDTVVGDGDLAENGDVLSVHYTGTFMDGSKFDSSLDRGTPFSFVLGAGNVIKGWDEGMLGMNVGGKRNLTIPPMMGYGMSTYGPIPGGSVLYFEVELLGVEKK
jgi:FKBP-type peptidyl-prolyl cis-trans isomerase